MAAVPVVHHIGTGAPDIDRHQCYITYVHQNLLLFKHCEDPPKPHETLSMDQYTQNTKTSFEV